MRNRPTHTILRGMDQVLSRFPATVLGCPTNDQGDQLDNFLQALRRLRPKRDVNIGDLRRGFETDMKAMRRGFPIGNVKNFEVAGRSVRLYQPTHGIGVLALYFHGGGFVMGSLETHDDACRLLAQQSGISLLAIDYRLAPEHPYPAALEDAQTVLQWAHSTLPELEESRLAIAGDSAGGNIATVVARMAATQGIHLASQLLIYPGVDLLTPRPSQSLFNSGYFLHGKERTAFYNAYLKNIEDWRSPMISPLLSETPKGTAASLTVTAGFDMLRDEGLAYAEQMQRSCPQARQLHFGALGHGFINLASIHQASEQALITLAKEWQRLTTEVLNLNHG